MHGLANGDFTPIKTNGLKFESMSETMRVARKGVTDRSVQVEISLQEPLETFWTINVLNSVALEAKLIHLRIIKLVLDGQTWNKVRNTSSGVMGGPAMDPFWRNHVLTRAPFLRTCPSESLRKRLSVS